VPLQLKELCTRISTLVLEFKKIKHGFLDIREDNAKYRMAALGTAVFLGIIALILGLSLLNAVFGLKVFPLALGNFFARSYGILAFFIPVFLGYAAFMLADPHWRPDRIFIFGAGIFPFLTLALGFAFIRDFEVRSRQFAFLDFSGKTGFSFTIIVITLLEVLALRMLKNSLFPAAIKPKDKQKGKRRQEKNHRPGKLGVFMLPPPEPKLHEAYLEAAAARNWNDERPALEHNASKNFAETQSAGAGITLRLPELKPLASAAAFQRFNSGKAEEVKVEYTTGFDEPLEAENKTGTDVKKESLAADSVERALEEAEVLAAIHSEQVRKKAASPPHVRPYKRKYQVPVEILNQYPDGEYWVIDQATRDAAVTLRETLEEFKIQAEVTGIRKGPVITMFEILPAPGVKLSRIVNLQDNIALRLAASSVRIVAPIPGKHAVGIEVPNAKRNIVSFREIIEGELQREGKRPEIPVVMGKDITGEAQTVDLVSMPHLLIAGATGAGKSVSVNAMILSILYQLPPTDCRLILIDPKIVELKLYNDIPHLLTPVITEPKRAFQALQYCIYEMERRYACLDSMGVRDIRNYNKRIKEKNIAQEHMPYIVVVIDEFADLMATTGKELESTVARLAAMSRAVGIHLVLATQRPSIDVITGLIKANIPSRIAFMVASKMDSRIIIDMVGAEKLLGKGDMLYAGVVDPFPIRMQGAFVSEEEVEAVVAHVKTYGEPDYIDDEIFYDDDEEVSPSLFSDGEDPLYDKALEIVMQQGKASASYIQRRLKIGYNRAARIVEEMAAKGVVGPAQGSKPRELLRGV
jgi:S-DNA-T family DNA segregation ATPase FtsK/SpoIIIE